MSLVNQALLVPNNEELPAPPTPLAMIKGQAILDLPNDLYIPPDAMRVLLETFEGPLDFLLYLIRKQNLDILDIPIADVTKQYMAYIDLMKDLSLDLAAEYLVMAAILAEIKSRMLLPLTPSTSEEEQDPRAELVKRLQAYEQYKQAAQNIDHLPRLERDLFIVETGSDDINVVKPLPNLILSELVHALSDVLKRLELTTNHHVALESLTIQEKMTTILTAVHDHKHVLFSSLFNINEGRLGVVVTFLAMLELLKQHAIDFVQAAAFAPIYLQPKNTSHHE